MTAILLALAIAAGILGAIEVFRSAGQSLVAWACVALSLAFVIPAVAALS